MTLKNDFAASDNLFLRFSVVTCKGDGCKGDPDKEEFFKKHPLALLQDLAFIDYEDVQAEDGLIKHTFSDIKQIKVNNPLQ